MVKFLIILMLIFSSANYALAASFDFGLRAETGASWHPSLQIGEKVEIPLYIEQSGGPIFVVETNLKFPSNILWAESFNLSSQWVPVSGEERNLIDNGRGIVRVVAGLEQGISGRTLLGTLTLIAVGPGEARVETGGDSVALNALNENVLESGAVTDISVVAPSEEGAPPSLFDIRLELSKTVFHPGETVTPTLSFGSFGSVPTPVNIFFTLTDESGKVFASLEESLVVETEAVLLKKFETSDLPYGNYIIHAHTRYNVDVEDDFHASFSVSPAFSPLYFIIAGFGFVLALAAVLAFWFRSKRKLDTKVEINNDQ